VDADVTETNVADADGEVVWACCPALKWQKKYRLFGTLEKRKGLRSRHRPLIGPGSDHIKG
jgi:hypothetical protein